LAFWNIVDVITLLGQLIIDTVIITALMSGNNSVQADIKLLAIFKIRISWVGVLCQIKWVSDRTRPSVVKCFLRAFLARIVTSVRILSTSIGRPITYSRVLIEPETRGTLILSRLSILAREVDVTDGLIGMGVVTIQARAFGIVSLGILKSSSVTTVDIKEVVARFVLSAIGIKDESITAQDWCGICLAFLLAIIVLVTLIWVFLVYISIFTNYALGLTCSKQGCED